VQILLTNDDGIHAPGIRSLQKALTQLGDVEVVAPLAEQSGVGLSITYLHPLMIHHLKVKSTGAGRSPAVRLTVSNWESWNSVRNAPTSL